MANDPTPVDAGGLWRTLDETVRCLRSDPAAGLIRPRVSSRLVAGVIAESRFTQYGREFSFRSDEAAERGGTGTAPSPLRYFLSGLAFCQIVWYAKGSALVGCILESVEIDVETFLDMRGEHRIGDVPAYPQWLLLEARIGSPSPADRVLTMVEEANARCPVFNLVRRAVPIYERITHNGCLLRDTAPRET